MERKVKKRDLPQAVQQAVQAQSKGATLRGLSTEVDNGKTLYEAEMVVNGHVRDVSIDAQGTVVSVEEEVAIGSIPAAAREAVQKAVGTGRLMKLETVTENGATAYEAQIRKARKTSEVKVDADGHPVK